MVHSHRILQDSLIEQHLYLIVFFRLHLAADGILVRLTGLHFNERGHIPLHVVQTPLQAQCFTDVRGFQHGISPIEFIAGCTECFCHRPADIVEMALAIGKEFGFLLPVAQVGTCCQLNGIRTEGLLHACQIIGCLLSMNPLVQKEVGNITQQ